MQGVQAQIDLQLAGRAVRDYREVAGYSPRSPQKKSLWEERIMKHKTWEIPAEKQRSKGEQVIDDLKFTAQLLGETLIGPFKPSLPPLTQMANDNKIPVIIVPGFICRPAVYKKMQRKIHAAGYPCHVLSMGFQVGSIRRKEALLSEYLTAHQIDEAYVVAHSMGGLVLTSSIQQGETRVRHGWTLGAPLFGTNIVWLLTALVGLTLVCNQSSGWHWGLLSIACFLSPALRQMSPQSDFLEFSTKAYPDMSNVTSVFCSMDTVVCSAPWNEPGSTSRFRRDTDVLFPEVGHNNLAMGDNALIALVDAIEAENTLGRDK